MSIPLFDTTLAIARRFLRGQPIFGADRAHIHHKLLARGLTPRRVTLLIYAVCALSAGLSLLQSIFHERFAGVTVVLFCVVACIAIQRLGYSEFGTAGRMVMTGAFRRLLNSRLKLDEFGASLRSASTTDDCWDVIHRAYPHFGFSEVILRVGDRVYTHSCNGHQVAPLWTLQIPLTPTDSVTLLREFSNPVSPVAGSFADCLAEILSSKLASNHDSFAVAATDPVKRNFASA